MPEPILLCADRLPAEPGTIETIHDHLEDLWAAADHVPALDRMAFDTAVIETVSNTIRHGVGDPGPVELGMELVASPAELRATIVEFGAASAAPTAPLGTVPLEDVMTDALAESGRGLALIRALVSLDFERAGATNVWRLYRPTNATESSRGTD
ncbi:ATP-binding protein [Citricoccus sp.]|uniref:ATP-binding protein n=1 Tax=Citricoccus sp. TaxID=1978372 RepID=UPI0028BD6DA9|nr:ATP-binding protein [Citricoccus sp.]